MSLLIMAVHDTVENQRTEYTAKTLDCLLETVDFWKHRLIISDNGSCDDTHKLYLSFMVKFKRKHEYQAGREMGEWLPYAGNYPVFINNGKNLGTAEAINKGLALRKPGEHCIKLDNDIVIHPEGWVEEMEEAISREPLIGIIGLKRKDLIQWPGHPDPNFRSELVLLPHEPLQRWIVVERTADIMGTCTMFNSALLDKVGYSLQPGVYGFEDNLMCHRSHIAGFYNCFLPHINIDHIDPGGTPYQKWKQDHSGEHWKAYHKIVHAMISGEMSIYYKPENL